MSHKKMLPHACPGRGAEGALHNPGCSWGLNPPHSSRDLGLTVHLVADAVPRLLGSLFGDANQQHPPTGHRPQRRDRPPEPAQRPGRQHPAHHDFLTVGIDPDAASDLFAVLANREHRLPTMIAAQSGPGYWLEALPDRVAADSIVNRLANHARKINLGQIDMCRHRGQQARATDGNWQ